MIQITRSIELDPDEIQERFIHSSGPGGQNVNKVSTAVELRLDVAANISLPVRVKQRLATLAGRRMTKEGVLVLTAQRFRTQERNRQDAQDRLLELLQEAAAPPPPVRRPTKPTLGAKKRRLESKSRRGTTKKLRGSTDDG